MLIAKRSLLIAFLVCLSAGGLANSATQAPSQQPKSIDEIAGLVTQYCGACHGVPSPALMPKKDWPYAVKKMAEMAATQMKKEFIPAEHIRDITAYYYGSAPTQLPRLPYSHATSSTLQFRGALMGRKANIPLILSIDSVDLLDKTANEFLVCDAETNEVSLLTISPTSWNEKVLASVAVPSKTDVVDFDLDGDQDIIVASLGLIFPPQGTYAGKVVLLRQNAKGEFEKETLLDNVGRITDARAVDIDGDKDMDIAVAMFGGDVPGALGWLENKGNGKFSKHSLLEQSGGLNITPADLNNDGRIDFVSLVAQEHEKIVAFINIGKGKFESITLFKAAHPMVGSTGMNLVDLDQDKDLDVLFTNGDAHDLQFDPKPYHGLQWLENKGDLTFEFHDIARYYGAANAIAGDLDSDGDLDIVASSWNNYWDDPNRHAIVWFENDGKQGFSRRNILSRPQSITALELEDITGDGRIDLLSGVFQVGLLKRYVDAQNGEGVIEKEEIETLKPRIVILQNSEITH